MKKHLSSGFTSVSLLVLLILVSFNASSQVGIGNTDPHSSAFLDIGNGTLTNTMGLLIPRVEILNMTTAAPVTSPAIGLLVYNTRTSTGTGFYYWNGSRWIGIDGGKNWQLSGNAGTLAGTDFLGTTDNVALQFKTRNFSRFEITSGTSQTAGGRMRAFTNGTSSQPIYSWNTNPGTGMFQAAGNILAFSTNTNERMRIFPDGKVMVNGTSAIDRFSVWGNTDEDVIGGRSYGDGKGVFGYAYGTGMGLHGQTPGSGNGVFAASTGTASGLTAITLGNGTAAWVQNSGVGDGMFINVTDGDGIFNNVTNGSGIYNKIFAVGNAGVITNLEANGGIGELIAFGNKSGTGVQVDANPIGTSGDVWSFFTQVKSASAVVGNTVSAGVLGAEQHGRSHGILMSHYGPEGRNVEFNSINPNNYDPNIFSVSTNRASTILAQNQNNSIGAVLAVADISYLGTDGRDHIAVSGFAHPINNYGIGVKGTGGWYGVHGVKTGPYTGYGVFSTGNYGGTGAKFFVIDDPRDPENKYLRHMSIESNEILNFYRGTAVFNEEGIISVQLPEYYDIINKNASYQLTPIGAAMPNLHIQKEVENGIFVIAGGLSGKKVAWVLTAERNDPYLQQYPESREVVVDKSERRGQYLMPELYGQPKEKMIGFYEPTKAEMSTLSKPDNVELLNKEDKNTKTQVEQNKKMVLETEAAANIAHEKKTENSKTEIKILQEDESADNIMKGKKTRDTYNSQKREMN